MRWIIHLNCHMDQFGGMLDGGVQVVAGAGAIQWNIHNWQGGTCVLLQWVSRKGGNLSHTHGLMALVKEDLVNEELCKFNCDLQKYAVCNMIPTEEIDECIKQGLFKTWEEWFAVKVLVKKVLPPHAMRVACGEWSIGMDQRTFAAARLTLRMRKTRWWKINGRPWSLSSLYHALTHWASTICGNQQVWNFSMPCFIATFSSPNVTWARSTGVQCTAHCLW